MLKELHIKNFAIIEDQIINFGSGLNVISGETGTGKSIVLQALELLLGARPKPKFIRKDTDGWELEALFDLSKLNQNIVDELPDIARTAELVVSRSMSPSGRARVFINGKLATVSLLEETVSKILNICGQNQHIMLLKPGYHLNLIDNFIEDKALLTDYQSVYTNWKEKKERLNTLEKHHQQNLLRRTELENLVEELSSIDLYEGIRSELEEQVKRYQNAEALINGTQNLLELLSSEEGLFERLYSAAAMLKELEELDPAIKKNSELFVSARTMLEEFEQEISAYSSGLELDSDTLEELRDKLATVASLERRYRTNDSGLVELLKQAERELTDLKESDNLEELRAEVARLSEELTVKANNLSKLRKKSARRLSLKIEEELKELNMPHARIKIDIKKNEPGPNGIDRVEFLIATNSGETVMPLKEIASGGELSRIMLVLKKIFRDENRVNVLVFDEVDSGISGRVARAVGEKLKSLSENSQVICITHLAQVASLADHHFVVDKMSGPRTVSVIKELDKASQVDEIARMLSGHKITEAARRSAKELLKS
ncbi:MAG: DNA repair protein RecN [Candidatus Dadabacteria bacterium]|nr:MAG: DNA repair protein RecN [Candidatus Dadabacteria bacterium]